MMHRCSSSHGNMVGPCTCGLFHSQTNSFSMLFSTPNHKTLDEADMYQYPFTSSSSSSVDCTLSLGTPSSTRGTNDTEKRVVIHNERRRPSFMSSFCWDMLQHKHAHSPPPPPTQKSSHGGSNGNINNNYGGDTLLARRCANCDTTSTPLWRNGPRGPKSLCNACGIRFKKEERRAAATTTTTNNNGGALPGGGIEAQHMINNSSWVHQCQAQKMACFSGAYGNEFRFIENDDHRDSDTTTGIPFLSWRLNVTDKPSLVHDFTTY